MTECDTDRELVPDDQFDTLRVQLVAAVITGLIVKGWGTDIVPDIAVEMADRTLRLMGYEWEDTNE